MALFFLDYFLVLILIPAHVRGGCKAYNQRVGRFFFGNGWEDDGIGRLSVLSECFLNDDDVACTQIGILGMKCEKHRIISLGVNRAGCPRLSRATERVTCEVGSGIVHTCKPFLVPKRRVLRSMLLYSIASS